MLDESSVESWDRIKAGPPAFSVVIQTLLLHDSCSSGESRPQACVWTDNEAFKPETKHKGNFVVSLSTVAVSAVEVILSNVHLLSERVGQSGSFR